METLSHSNIAFIQKQLNDPQKAVHHRSTVDAFIPMRLLDLGIDCVSSPRLVESSESDQDREYATLSYCWGSATEAKQQLKLTREN